MILEEATKEAFGYYPSDLTRRSEKFIITACTLCGRFKVARKHDYHTFCVSCVRKDKKFSEETKAKMAKVRKGEKHPLFGKHHTAEAKVKMRAAKKGKPRIDLKGSNNSRWKG